MVCFECSRFVKFAAVVVILMLGLSTGAYAQSRPGKSELNFLYAFGAQTGAQAGGKIIPVQNETTLRSGDRLKLFVEPKTELYFYLMHLSSQGDLTPLFPVEIRNTGASRAWRESVRRGQIAHGEASRVRHGEPRATQRVRHVQLARMIVACCSRSTSATRTSRSASWTAARSSGPGGPGRTAPRPWTSSSCCWTASSPSTAGASTARARRCSCPWCRRRPRWSRPSRTGAASRSSWRPRARSRSRSAWTARARWARTGSSTRSPPSGSTAPPRSSWTWARPRPTTASGADGAFLGGAIAPGMKLGLEALAANTARLPRIELRTPDRAIGRDTVSAMQSGTVFGYQAAVTGLLARIRRELAEQTGTSLDDVHGILTGGLSIEPWARDVDGVEVIDPDLTLKGLAILYARSPAASRWTAPDERAARGPADRPRRLRLDRCLQGRGAPAPAASGGRRRRRDAHAGRDPVRRAAHVRGALAPRRGDGRPGPAPRPADRPHRGRGRRRRDRGRARHRPLAGLDGERDRERHGDGGLPRDERPGRGRAGDGRRHVDAPGDAGQRRAAPAGLRLPDRAARRSGRSRPASPASGGSRTCR